MTAPEADERCLGDKCQYYTGTQNVANNGKECLLWRSWFVGDSILNRQIGLFGTNYCRNANIRKPNGEVGDL